MKTWNNANRSYCKHGFLNNQWYLARLAWGKPFSNQKAKYFQLEWSLATFKILNYLAEYRVQELKKLCRWVRWRKYKWKYTLFLMRTSNIFELNCSYFFRQFEPQVFIFLLLFIYVLINCNLYTWQLLHTWSVGKAGNFPF